MSFKYKSELHGLASGAGKVLMKYLNKTHRIEIKPGAGIVTEADKGAEKFILKRLLRKYPNSSIISEESGEFLREESLCWIIDPLDGTSNYAHGFPSFCVSIGVAEHGILKAGVVYNPWSKEMFFAERGKGAYLNGRRIRVSKTKKLSEALLGTGFYYSKGHSLRKEMRTFTRMIEATLGVRRPGAAALDLAYVACGRYDGFWERRLSPWDVAAGIVLVEEAGGTITNYSGRVTDIYAREIVASNSLVHRQMVNVLKPR